MITSHHNDTLKDVRRLQQRKRGETRFVAEGEDLVEAAQAAGWPALLRLEAGVDVKSDALAAVSQLGSGTRVLAVFEERWADAPRGPVAVYLHGVSDPGNVGTVLRSALAFGSGCVVIGPGTADPYGPKAVRASMGAIFSVPVVRADLADCPRPRIALAARRGERLEGPGEGTVVVGAERDGLPPDVLGACERTAHIPMAAAESLNAAVAASVALYELGRPPEEGGS